MRAPLAILTLTVCALTTTGCEEDVTAITGTDLAYSLYGMLTPEADTQWVRLFEIERRLVPERAEPLGVTIRSHDLNTGATQAWTEVVARGRDGMYAHLFFAPFTPAFGHRYRVEVRHPDGRWASAEATVPERAELALVGAGDGSERVVVRGPVSHFIRVRVTYDIKFGRSDVAVLTVPRNYDGRIVARNGEWELLIDLAEDRRSMELSLRELELYVPSFGIELLNLRLRLVVADPAWRPPDGTYVFDPDLLVEPGQLTNVTNGFGFVGAGYSLSMAWMPEDATLRGAGFQVPGG